MPRRTSSGLTYCGATIERVFDLAQAWAASQPDYAATTAGRVRGQLQRMLAQPARPEPLAHRVPSDDAVEPVAGITGAD